ncbi:MAG: DUF1801 domain-containing protein [Dehalococcoidia bacterium]
MTFEEYLEGLPEERRAMVAAVRRIVVDRLPDGYVESITPALVTYDVPLERYADTYNGKPLNYVALAPQKRYVSLYLMGLYGQPEQAAEFERAYRATGKRYDVGKSCVRFRRLDDLPLDLIGDAVAALDVDGFVALAEAAKRPRRK